MSDTAGRANTRNFLCINGYLRLGVVGVIEFYVFTEVIRAHKPPLWKTDTAIKACSSLSMTVHVCLETILSSVTFATVTTFQGCHSVGCQVVSEARSVLKAPFTDSAFKGPFHGMSFFHVAG
ncbi:hypothetical protein [Candidatus Sororendozoicomonas aggregata]|uniref:hypothetical protein n=1 Tax=Candidatus Sororendozoicomonas aggregata TaxID=3073239 RepID=UPI002ED65AB4